MPMAGRSWIMERISRVRRWENSATQNRHQIGERDRPFMLHAPFVIWRLPGFCIGEVIVIRPIPKSLLIHDIQLQTITGQDAWGKAKYSAPQEIKRVRVEPSSRVVRDKNNQEIQLAATIIHDCKNSSAAEYHVDQIVTFKNETYRIETVEPLYDDRRLHHVEVGMIRYAKD